jgi:hypothetical protein
MLDHLKIMKEIARALPDLYAEVSREYQCAQNLFEWVRTHPEIIDILRTGPHAVPLWQGALDDTVSVRAHTHPYTVVATDGSQIYPDRHQGVSYFVLNSGTASFCYGTGPAEVLLESAPRIVTQFDDLFITEDIVNCRRAELEFEVGLAASKALMRAHPDLPCTFLCDGSLIFWHLESKSPALKERFLHRYIALLEEFYQARVPIAGYISLPKSKELVALLKNSIALKVGPVGIQEELLATLDTDLCSSMLKPSERSTVYTHNSALALSYPSHLVPCFVYLHVGDEIARVEIPRWVAEDSLLRERVLAIIVDQALKGNGYPIALAEAHEQAVIKNHERELFFSLVRRLAPSNAPIASSQKALKKRYVSV